MELEYKIQKYAWGKLGTESKVAELCKTSNSNFTIENNTPYAELWMGTHPNGPSIIKETGETLLSFIRKNPEVLGENIKNIFGNDLPFLFKVLSVNKALSIQAHPSKEHAKQLHNDRPDLYKDPNHKPELAIALTPFEALCGFRPINEIKFFLKNIPELSNLIGKSNVDKLIQADDLKCIKQLKQCFEAFMKSSEECVTENLKKLLKRLFSADEEIRKKHLASLVERLNSQFPNDVGCFAVYFLNVVILKPFEAIYLGPNEPHAYLSGDCVECMACSDNVVRAGLTPKYKDVETLCSMLDYKGEAGTNKLFKYIEEDNYSVIFKPPVPDFAVAKIEIPEGVNGVMLKKRTSASILLIISGCATADDDVTLKSGTVVFIPAETVINITNVMGKLLLFQAMANI